MFSKIHNKKGRDEVVLSSHINKGKRRPTLFYWRLVECSLPLQSQPLNLLLTRYKDIALIVRALIKIICFGGHAKMTNGLTRNNLGKELNIGSFFLASILGNFTGVNYLCQVVTHKGRQCAFCLSEFGYIRVPENYSPLSPSIYVIDIVTVYKCCKKKFLDKIITF